MVHGFRLSCGVTVPEGGQALDPEADDSYFELECVKLWWNETA